MIAVLLAAEVVFMVWAIVHTNARIGWDDDDRDAEQFIAELRDEDGPRLAFADDIVAVAMLDGELGKGRPVAPAADANRDGRPPVLWLCVRSGRGRGCYRMDPATESAQLVLFEPEAVAR